MKLATLDDGTADGRLLIVTRDLARRTPAQSALTMQAALDRWIEVEPLLRAEAELLERDGAAGTPLDLDELLAAMPRSYQFLDGSAFLAHNHILADAWGYERRTPADPPLMYQGLSDRFLPPSGTVCFRSVGDDIDFEAEYGVITDEVPMGVTEEEALRHARLLVVINDWSLRAFGPAEMKAGFGFIHAKPPSTISAIAVTPDEIGEAWRGGRIHLPLTIRRGGDVFGHPDGGEMTYGFGRLVAHAAATRSLCAGTVVGSGTVSNRDAEAVGSGCIAERRALDQTCGRPLCAFLQPGEIVEIDCAASGRSVFGNMRQTVATLDQARD